MRTAIAFATLAALVACGGQDVEPAGGLQPSGGSPGAGGATAIAGGASGATTVAGGGGAGGTGVDAAPDVMSADSSALTCSEAAQQFSSAIAAARACDPTKPSQCTKSIDLASSCLSCPGQTFVETSNTAAVLAIRAAVVQAASLHCGNCGGCAGGPPPAVSASCIAAVGAGGASCVDSYGAIGGAVDAATDARPNFPDVLEGIWLFGWPGGNNHYSWIRFSPLATMATDASFVGSGTVDVVAGQDAVKFNVPYWPCSGRGRWFLTARPNTFSLELPSTCTDASDEVYVVTSFDAVGSGPPGSLSHISMTRSPDGMHIDGSRYPDSQCDATMTSCTPVM